MNPRITNKERNLIKGALRRAFSRSDLRKAVVAACIIEHSDPSRPRVKTWARCQKCAKPEAKSYMEVDHINPVIPVTSSLAEMSIEELVDRLWCDPANLQCLCVTCHDEKTALEASLRKKTKEGKRNGKRKPS